MARAGLTPDIVVAAAISLLDSEGVSALTIGALAKQLGVAGPALYKHIAGLDDLRARIRMQLLTELAEQLRKAATGRTNSDALKHICAEYRAFAHRHPGAYELTLAAPAPKERQLVTVSDDTVEVLVRVVDSYGIEAPSAIDATRFVRAALHGFVTLELAGGFGLPREIEKSFAALRSGLDHVLTNWV